jgi:hypothetical protein
MKTLLFELNGGRSLQKRATRSSFGVRFYKSLKYECVPTHSVQNHLISSQGGLWIWSSSAFRHG